MLSIKQWQKMIILNIEKNTLITIFPSMIESILENVLMKIISENNLL